MRTIPNHPEALAFPLPAVAGMSRVTRALLLLAVDPVLKGIVIQGLGGMGKSVLARAFRSVVCIADGEPPFVQITPSVTKDQLLGSLDIEATLRTGKPQASPGLLARAHGGFLVADDLNLLDARAASCIRSALTQHEVAEFSLIATCNPEGGELRHSLADSVALHVTETTCLPLGDRVELLRRITAFDRDPFEFLRRYAPALELLKERVAGARRRLPDVQMALSDYSRLCTVALNFGIEGHRTEVFAARLARAHAAWNGRLRVETEDLEAAERLVLEPRAAMRKVRSSGLEPEYSSEETLCEEPGQGAEDRVFPTVPANPPDGVMDWASPRIARDRKGTARRLSTGGDAINWTRGRYVRPLSRRPPGGGRLAVEATLRVAAPLQALRLKSAAAAPAVRITKNDLRFKEFREKQGMLIIFAVDASGSMALQRISQAKGALIRLLHQAYLHRDQVALIAFRGEKAEVLLPPGRSVELAKRAIDVIPTGGATPLAAALESALYLARRSTTRGVRQTLLVLLTDGHGNIGSQQLQAVAGALRDEGIASVVMDAGNRFAGHSKSGQVAQMLGGRHVFLPYWEDGAVADAVSGAAESLRRQIGGTCTTG
ncbi:MAG: VWA domain-containing protein [Bryobacteraceae bacterium]|nr:VWA domain-containing protein [Bryobacterales bacterium]NUN02678.1 VWA domain-containing protein [Bryobacteraceae bacterium]